MMNTWTKKWILGVAAGLLAAGALAGCGGAPAASSAQGGAKKIVKVAHTQHYVPYDYVDANNQSQGMEVAVMKAVAKKLPQYEFQFVPTSDDDLLVGVESGKYDIGTKGVWKTPPREKKYLFTKNPIAASVIGIAIRKEDAATIKNIDDFAAAGKKLVPIAPQNAQYQVVKDYNEAHKDHPIALEASENFQVADAYTWVLEGRYDGYFNIELAYKNNVTKESGAYHTFADQLSYFRYKAIPTYPLINKKDTKLAEEVDKAIAELKADGTLAKLENQYFGEEISKLVK